MTLKVVLGGHVSFPLKLRERRIVLFGEKVRELTEKSSPCIIQVITCCNIEVSNDILSYYLTCLKPLKL